MNLTHKQKQECVRVLRKAAGSILSERYTFCCKAIQEANHPFPSPVPPTIFRDIYWADSDGAKNWGNSETSPWWVECDDEDREVRIFALLLAAEIVRTDSLPDIYNEKEPPPETKREDDDLDERHQHLQQGEQESNAGWMKKTKWNYDL